MCASGECRDCSILADMETEPYYPIEYLNLSRKAAPVPIPRRQPEPKDSAFSRLADAADRAERVMRWRIQTEGRARSRSAQLIPAIAAGFRQGALIQAALRRARIAFGGEL